MSFPRQITIFGGNGFIGRHLIKRLACTGAIIRVPTRNPEEALSLKPAGNVAQIVPFYASVRSEDDVRRAIGKSDAVINLIGILHQKGRNSFQAMHVEAAARIARLAREAGAQRLLHVSAIGADANSSAAYARSKAAGEEAVRTFFPDVSIIRPSVVFGPEDNFFNMFATMARYAPVLPLIGGGKTKFHPVYVGDVADAIAAAVLRENAVGHIYELGGPAIYTFRALLELMMKKTGRYRPLVNLPWGLAKLQAFFMELMPAPLLTRDQVELLKTDNVVSAKAKTLRDLGIVPTALEVILPTYMDRFKVGGPLKQAA